MSITSSNALPVHFDLAGPFPAATASIVVELATSEQPEVVLSGSSIVVELARPGQPEIVLNGNSTSEVAVCIFMDDGEATRKADAMQVDTTKAETGADETDNQSSKVLNLQAPEPLEAPGSEIDGKGLVPVPLDDRDALSEKNLAARENMSIEVEVESESKAAVDPVSSKPVESSLPSVPSSSTTTSAPAQEVEELNIVVDIGQDNPTSNTVNTSDAQKKNENGPGSEVQITAASAEVDENGESARNEGASQDAKLNILPSDAENQDREQSFLLTSTEKGGPRGSRLLNELQADRDGNPDKIRGPRKRKKTIHFMNSRVPHTLPSLESEDGSDGLESFDDADEVPIRPVQAPRRILSSKLKARTPIGDSLMNAPKNAKELMATGLLEGHHVRCTGRGEELTGILQDMGVLCDCGNCNGGQMVSISAFEAHSGSTSHHPSDNIYLENGYNLRDILNAGQEAAQRGDNIVEALKHAIGVIQGNVKRKILCTKCGSEGKRLVSCSGPRCSNVYHPECMGMSSSPSGDWFCPKCEKTMKKPQPSTNVKRKSSIGAEREEARLREKELMVLARSGRDANLHKALFLPDGLSDGTEVGYYNKSKCVLRGVKRGGGICCSCCDQEISCSAFEQHAGCEARRNPYGSILLADGRSLHVVCQQLAGENKRSAEADRGARDDEVPLCIECGESGDHLWCHGCDLTWCRNCAEETSDLEMQKTSDSDWYCRICQKDSAGATKGGRRVSGKRVDLGPEASTTDDQDRHILQLQAPDAIGGCVICKSWEFSKSGFDAMTMLLCDQCECEYHIGCLKESGLEDLSELPEGEWFCHADCKAIDEILMLLVANGPESLSDSIISELLESRQRQGGASEKAESSSPSFEWQILHGRGGNPISGQTLAEAVDIFSEFPYQIKDAAGGRNLIPLMVHSRRLKDYDFEGLFCVVLKLNAKVVSTALLRIFGRHAAEVPLVATSLQHQGQGFCKALMTTIERLLGVLSVERLVLPAATGAESIWVNKFGFHQMDVSQLSNLRSTVRMMILTGSSMLEKPIIAMTVLS